MFGAAALALGTLALGALPLGARLHPTCLAAEVPATVTAKFATSVSRPVAAWTARFRSLVTTMFG
jgi:hypothetical protein